MESLLCDLLIETTDEYGLDLFGDVGHGEGLQCLDLVCEGSGRVMDAVGKYLRYRYEKPSSITSCTCKEWMYKVGKAHVGCLVTSGEETGVQGPAQDTCRWKRLPQPSSLYSLTTDRPCLAFTYPSGDLFVHSLSPCLVHMCEHV